MLAAMQKIQRYLKYIVYPACIIMFAGAFVCARNAALPAMSCILSVISCAQTPCCTM